MGWWRFAAVYFIAAVGGSVLPLFGGISNGSAGASGAIFGLFAAAWILQRVTRMDTRPLTITIVVNFIFTFSIPQISKLGHLGGFVAGGLATLALLGWTTKAWNLKNRTPALQAAGLVAITVVMLVAAFIRVQSIKDEIRTNAVGLARTAVVHSVDSPGENYSRVITGVEEPVDNAAF